MKKPINNVEVYGFWESIKASKYPMSVDINKCTNDITKTVKNLGSVPTGTGHDNFLKGIVVQFDLTLTNKAWLEAERYHFLDFVSSQSTMHKITKFDLNKSYIKYTDPRCIEVTQEKVNEYNAIEDKNSEEAKEKYLEILYSNPSGMYITARMTTNYQQLKTIYQQRFNHRLPEWREFCEQLETLPSFLLLCFNGESKNKKENNNENN
jgi:hypothetical protein